MKLADLGAEPLFLGTLFLVLRHTTFDADFWDIAPSISVPDAKLLIEKLSEVGGEDFSQLLPSE